MQTAGWVLFGLIAVWVVPPVIAFVVRRLSRPEGVVPQTSARVTVVVAARNEADAIENTLRSLLDSQHPELTVVAVDDRSTDETGAIIRRVAEEDPRLQVVSVSAIPDGWLGKTHALWRGSQHAESDYLLFTDGDVVFDPLAISVAVDYAERHRLDHLCLLPQMIPGRLLENAAVCFFGLAYAIGMQVHLVRTGWPLAYTGVGAFSLVRTAVYRRAGGHAAIPLDVLDDVKLGKLMHRAGGRCDFLRAPELLAIRWHHSLGAVIRGLEKNAFASLNYSVPFVLLCTVVFFATMIAPYFLAALLPWPQSAGFLATVILWHVAYGGVCLLGDGGWKLIPLFPVGATLMSFAWWRSTWITLRQGGVRWRDSFYPLQQLRDGLYR